MSTCEQCWSDSQGPYGDPVRRYRELVETRKCTPEEQAGPGAGECPRCKRKTLHQYTAEPMCGCPSAFQAPSAEAIEAVRASLVPGDVNG